MNTELKTSYLYSIITNDKSIFNSDTLVFCPPDNAETGVEKSSSENPSPVSADFARLL